MKKQYKIFLNILITVLLIAGIGILGYLAYDYISQSILTKEAEDAVDEFVTYVEKQSAVVVDISENNQVDVNSNKEVVVSNKTVPKYKNFNIIGSIQIPKTKIKYPIVDVITPDAIAVAVTQIYGSGLNEVR